MNTRLRKALLLFCSLVIPVVQAIGAEEGVATSYSCERDIGKTISALISGAPLVLADFAMGETGATHPGLAASMQVENSPRQVLDGLEYPSPLEIKMSELVEEHACFRAYQRLIEQGAEDVSGASRAIIQFHVPHADMQHLTIEYLPGKIRQNFLYSLMFNIELRDGDGRVVFSRTHAESYRRTCFQELPSAECTDLAGDPVSIELGWRLMLDQALANLLAGSAEGIQQWHDSLRELHDTFLDRRYSQELEFDAVQARSRDQLAEPYYFVQTPMPRVNINGLLAGLEDRGLNRESYERPELQAFYNTLFRSYLDESLRENIINSDQASNARIMLLSDAEGAAFRNAMMIACAEQGRGFNADDCLAPVLLIEQLCDPQHDIDPRVKDKCVLASVAFGQSVTRNSESELESLHEAEQHIQLASYLRAPSLLNETSTVSCANNSTGEITSHVVGVSERYLRIDNVEGNDDGLYLTEAAHNALMLQAKCLAEAIVNNYQQLL